MSAGLPPRMMAKIQVLESACWQWQGSRDSGGYGTIGVNGGTRSTHRYAYELMVGTIPVGLMIDHLCRNRACCNPAHMEPVTSRVNTLRGTGKSAVRARLTECPQGHSYDEVNTYINTYGSRVCRTCRRAVRARRRQRLQRERAVL